MKGLKRASNLYREVEKVLLDSTLRSGWTSPLAAPSRSMRAAITSATVRVTASGNVAVYSISSLMRLFSGPEVPILTWEMEVAQQQWSQDCDEWNAQMDAWDATKDAVADAAEEVANDLEALASAIEAGLGPLETADAACKPTNGKKLCVDFFIMNCHIWIIGLGDCRDFDKDAEYESSRVQLYLNPNTMAWEAKFNCSIAMLPTSPLFPYVTPHSFCDSAQVFNPNEDVLTTQPDASGWRTVTMKFKSPACIRRNNGVCPAIDALISSRPNAAADGGYELTWDRDGFPSMGVYARNAADTGWNTVKEDAQKTRDGVTAIRALAGQIRSKGYNYPPPSSPQPPGCRQ